MGKIRITDTSLRDGHQSLWATRMKTEDMVPILDKLDNVGYHSLEVWGGATFDVCMRFLNEDPWERLRTIRQHVKKTKLQMLLRGQSLVGYNHYPDDIVEKFVEMAAENGIDIFRVFDALNDIRNLETCMRTVKKMGKHTQACVVYTISPVHSIQHFVETALKLQDMGADSICIKDMAGLLSPYISFDLVKAMKENLDIPVQLHTHYIGGLAMATLLKAVEAGVDVVDTASVPLAFGSSQPPVETLVRALQDSDADTGMDLAKLFEIADYFDKLRKVRGFERGVTRITDMKVFEHQVPGGMISNFISQLEEQNATDRIGEVLEEIPRVRKDMGYPPLVTPTSQIISTQAVVNVLVGERYKICPGEVKDYVRGLYGKPPVEISEEIKQKIIGDEEVTKVRPADLLEPIWEKCSQETAGVAKSDEDVLLYALFPQVALKFLENRNSGKLNSESSANGIIEPKQKNHAAVAVEHEGDGNMDIDEVRELVRILEESQLEEMDLQKGNCRLILRKSANGNSCTELKVNASPVDSAGQASVAVEKTFEQTAQPKEIPAYDPDASDVEKVLAPMTGTFYSSSSPEADPFVELGDHVEEGETLCLFEAMKLINEINSECDGTIVEILAQNGETVKQGQVLFLIKKDS